MKSATSFGSFLRTYCAIGAAVSLMAILQTQVQTQALLKLSTRYKWAILIVLLALNAAVGFYVLLHRKSPAPFWENWQLAQAGRLSGLLAGLGLVVLAPILLLYARADFFGKGVEAFFRLLWLFWWIALAQAAGLRLATGIDWPRALSAALLLDGLTAQLFTLGTAVSNYPFSMGWSEASRYYYGSLIFSKSIYGQTLPLSVMHGSRYLLQSIPFVLRGVQLWAARLWQVVLWTGLTLGASAAVIRRLGKRRPIDSLLAGGWLFLFFFQGAVYYHLQVCVIIILLGVRSGHPWRSLAAVAAASFWAGMSRVNWFPVPAMLAITLYLLERKVRNSHGILDYMRTPALWGGVGLFFAAAGQVFYVTISGNTNLEAFASSFNSALLWYRWLPSPTNPIGIVPGVLIVSAPVIALLVWRRRAERGGMHTLREIGLGLILLILGAGGLVVSTKIGGGGDLHNMDAYLVVLAILGAYELWGGAEIEAPIRAERRIAPWSVTAALALVPVAFALLRLGGPFSYDATRANADLATLAQEVRTYGKGGEVLFMYERHLQTFGLVPRVPMIADYEVVTLMEMAISGNRTYLNKYYDDLRTHRFAAIVAHPQNLGVETGDFIEENDAWNRLVGQPLLCQYKPAITLDYSKIQVLVPRARPCPEFPPEIEGR